MASILGENVAKGVGALLVEHRLRVPFYQRSYAWKRTHVETLLDDFRRAIGDGKHYYFLGSIVGCEIPGAPDEIEVVDGQQRLATTAILLAAIRNHLLKLNDVEGAARFEDRYLFITHGFKNPTRKPRMVLNEVDNRYFQDAVMNRPKPAAPGAGGRVPKAPHPEGPRSSHRLISEAVRIVTLFVEKQIAGSRLPTDQKGELDKWIDFIETKAQVIFITVPDAAEAFMVFETLNDRGLELTIADITKNYLFSLAGNDRIEEVKTSWTRMAGHLVSSTDSKITKEYIHHLWSSIHGVTRDKEIFAAIKNKITNSNQTVEFAAQLADKAELYQAICNSDAAFWNEYGPHAKRHVGILNRVLRVSQIRMLLLAILDTFSIADVVKVLPCCVNWSVRYSVAGGSPSVAETAYSSHAIQIRSGEIANADDLIASMAKRIPNDATFKAAFAAESDVANPIARYYLQCLQKAALNEEHPHLGEDDEVKANLEHILPQSPDKAKWAITEPHDLERLVPRLGNLALLAPKANTDRGNRSFAEAKPTYLSCPFTLTQEVARDYPQWDEAAITKRQERLAELALIAWPIIPTAAAPKPKRKRT